jgi:hypothetical protein
MHTLIECLPVLAGLLVAILYRLTKSFPYKNACVLLLTFALGFLANRLSAEGFAFLYIDVIMACGSTLAFLSVSKPLFKRWV